MCFILELYSFIYIYKINTEWVDIIIHSTEDLLKNEDSLWTSFKILFIGKYHWMYSKTGVSQDFLGRKQFLESVKSLCFKTRKPSLDRRRATCPKTELRGSFLLQENFFMWIEIYLSAFPIFLNYNVLHIFKDKSGFVESKVIQLGVSTFRQGHRI